MERSRVVSLRCPRCRGPLDEKPDALICPSCRERFPIRDGIPCFEKVDEIYEGRFIQTIYHKGKHPWSLKRLRTALSKEGHFFNNAIPKGSLILDLGCGGGNTFFKTFGSIVGLDISFASVKQAAHVYDQVVCGSVLGLPFPDESFDYVVSDNVLEHMCHKDKDRLFEEMYRVTKRGGGVVHAVTVEGGNGFTRFAKRHPALYRRYFVEAPGHLGLEKPEDLIRRFEKAGFKVARRDQVYTSWARPLDEYLSKFDNEYKTLAPGLSGFIFIARLIEKKQPFKILKKPVRALISSVKALLDSHAPFGKGDLVYVYCKK
ncbi:MAG: methyltransferase domain-containing protein [Candidatus Omnitrophica bacterium]|nr:methyltransferase domain-containing protein [Candidatus Omnitrophota bacterium]